MTAWLSLPVALAGHLQLDTVGGERVGLGVEAPRAVLPDAIGDFAVSAEGHRCGTLLVAPAVAEVDMVPGADDVLAGNLHLWYGGIALGQYHGPSRLGPYDAAYATQHDGIGILVGR